VRKTTGALATIPVAVAALLQLHICIGLGEFVKPFHRKLRHRQHDELPNLCLTELPETRVRDIDFLPAGTPTGANDTSRYLLQDNNPESKTSPAVDEINGMEDHGHIVPTAVATNIQLGKVNLPSVHR
jgi:hypothetical protein